MTALSAHHVMSLEIGWLTVNFPFHLLEGTSQQKPKEIIFLFKLLVKNAYMKTKSIIGFFLLSQPIYKQLTT